MTKSSATFFHRLLLLCFSLFAFFFTACGTGVGGTGAPTSVSVPVNRGISGTLSVLPTVSGASPAMGNTDGNWTLTVNGSNFVDGMTVMVGSTECTSVTVISSEQLTCVAPAGTAGAAAVSVSDVNGHMGRMDAATTYVDTVNVSSFTPTATGFQATFNRAINVGTVTTPNIHLYESALAPFGAVDVTLEGESTGPVRGSLVVDQAYKRFTFLRTGGDVLAPDTYTVRLRSTATGFVDAGAIQLDGDDDGTTGDDFTTTFTVAPITQGLTVSVRDFMRGPGQSVNVPNTSAGIPIEIVDNDLTNPLATSIQFTIVYNPALLTVTGMDAGSDRDGDTSIAINTSVPGRTLVSISRSTGLVGAGPVMDFIRLSAVVPDTAPYGATHVLRIEDVSTGEETSEPITVNPGVHVVGYFSDLTRNSAYSAQDTSFMMRLVVALDTGLQNWSWIDPFIIADTNHDGAFNATDTANQGRLSVGTPVATIPNLPTPAVSLTFSTDP